jgi:hypothetical protein
VHADSLLLEIDMTALLQDYWSRAELAREIARTERTLARWCAQGIGPPVTWLGRTPYYHKSSVSAWLLSQERPFVRSGGRQTGRGLNLKGR